MINGRAVSNAMLTSPSTLAMDLERAMEAILQAHSFQQMEIDIAVARRRLAAQYEESIKTEGFLG